LPASFETDRERYGFAGRTLWDPPDPLPEPPRQRAQEFVRLQVEAIRRIIFPTHRL